MRPVLVLGLGNGRHHADRQLPRRPVEIRLESHGRAESQPGVDNRRVVELHVEQVREAPAPLPTNLFNHLLRFGRINLRVLNSSHAQNGISPALTSAIRLPSGSFTGLRKGSSADLRAGRATRPRERVRR